MNISALRHPKEKLYRLVCMIVGGLIWASLILGSVGSILVILIPMALVLWIAERFFRATVFGNSVMVNHDQYADLNKAIQEIAVKQGVQNIPLTFIVNAQGLTNALAIKFLSGKYILLFSDLVDLLWETKDRARLEMIIAHELAHHAAGHVNFWVNLLIKPAMFIPFLGAAYSRACELTADRIAASCIEDRQKAVEALVTLASGSRSLISQTNTAAFVQQEVRMPTFFGFIQEILSSHPRMTKRIIAINAFYDSKPTVAVVSQAA